MTLQEAYKQLLYQLYELYDNREAENIAALVIEHVTGQRKIDRIMNKLMPVSLIQQEELAVYTQQLLQHKPVQYVLHEAWFAGMRLYVDENVLIPRPETEELVEWVAGYKFPVSGFQFPVNKENEEAFLDDAQNITRAPATSDRKPATGFKILDIGTGSGCIPIALKKKFAQWEVHALDVSPGALEVAKRNALLQQTDITFSQTDILKEDEWQLLDVFDIIVSNPPYIQHSESSAMQNNVTGFEPHIALFVPDEDPLLFYKKIADFALLHLYKNGLVFFEINESLGKEACEMLAEKGFVNIELKKDMQGKERMVRGRI